MTKQDVVLKELNQYPQKEHAKYIGPYCANSALSKSLWASYRDAYHAANVLEDAMIQWR